MPQDNWLILGDRGTLSGTFAELNWQTVDVAALPKRTLETSPRSGERKYNRDDITAARPQWSGPEPQSSNAWNHGQFYGRLVDTLRHGGPLAVEPQSVARCMRLIAACHAATPASTTSPSAPAPATLPIHS
jgi:hypothetical protein